MDISLRLYKQLEDIYGYKIVNKDPLNKKELNKSIVTMYGANIGFDIKLFKTKKEREEWIIKENPKFALRYTYDYLGEVANKKHVIKEIDGGGTIRLIAVNALDKYSYDVYNFIKSKITGKYNWIHYMDDYSEKYRLCQGLIGEVLDEDFKQLKK